MCISCGCNDYEHRHPHSHSLVWDDVREAAEDAGISPKACAWNILRGTNAMTDSAAKSEDAVTGSVLKSDDESRFLLMVAYSPNRMPLRGADKKIDVASPEVLEKACWRFADNGLKVGMWHQAGGEHAARVVENSVYRNPVPWVTKDAEGNELVVKEGDWIVGMILEPETWALYKAGRIGGVSPQGTAGRKKASAETLARIGASTRP